MSARKSRPVLYEVIRGSERERKVRSAAPAYVERPRHAPEPSPAAEPPEPEEVAARPPTVQVAEGRLHLSLGWPSAAVLLAGCVVVLVVTFNAGQRYAQWGTVPEMNGDGSSGTESRVEGDRARKPEVPQRADNNVAPRERQRSAQKTPKPTPAVPRNPFVKGNQYVIIQHFPKRDRKAAENAREFLQSNGLDCAVDVRKNEFRLIATQPFVFDAKDARAKRRAAQEAERGVIKRVKELGKQYARDHGYAFDQAYLSRY